MHKMKRVERVFLAFLVFLFLGCSSSGKISYDNLTELISDAFSKGDREALISIEQSITENYFRGAQGLKFLKEKVFLLSLIGDYENATRVLTKGRDIFPGDIQVTIGLGLVAAGTKARKDCVEHWRRRGDYQ